MLIADILQNGEGARQRVVEVGDKLQGAAETLNAKSKEGAAKASDKVEAVAKKVTHSFQRTERFLTLLKSWRKCQHGILIHKLGTCLDQRWMHAYEVHRWSVSAL